MFIIPIIAHHSECISTSMYVRMSVCTRVYSMSLAVCLNMCMVVNLLSVSCYLLMKFSLVWVFVFCFFPLKVWSLGHLYAHYIA